MDSYAQLNTPDYLERLFAYEQAIVAVIKPGTVWIWMRRMFFCSAK